MTIHRLTDIICRILPLALLLILHGPVVYAQVNKLSVPGMITVGAEANYPPYSIIDENGTPDGFSVELMEAAAGVMGIDLIWETGTWTVLKDKLEKGQIDALPLVGRTPERENIFDFTFSYLTMHGTLFTRKENRDIMNLEDIQGKQVAVMAGDNAEEFLERTQTGAELVSLPTFEEAMQRLSEGEFDAVFIQKLVGLQIINKLDLLNLKVAGPPVDDFEQSFCFAVTEGNNELLSILNEGLSIVIADGTFQDLYNRWFSSIEAIERIRSRVIVGGDYNYPPFEFIDENGQPAGYTVELTYAVAHQLGIDVDIRLGPWNERLEALQNQEIDVIQGMFYSPERDMKFNLSQAHTYVSQVIVVREEDDHLRTMADLKDKKIMVQQGDIMHELAVKMGYEDQLVLFDSQENALRLLADGQYDCVLAAKMVAYYWIEKNEWNNLTIIEDPVLSAEYCFAFSQGNDLLLAQFVEGLAAIKASGEYRRIYTRWMGRYEDRELNFIDVLRYSLIVLVPVFLILIGFIAWNRSLGKRVRARTHELHKEIDERRKAEQQLISRENDIRLLLNSTAEGIYGIDLQGNCTFANRSCLALLGYEHHDQLIGNNMHYLIHHSYPDGSAMDEKECHIYKAIQISKGTHVDDEVLWRSDGTPFHTEYWSYPQHRDGKLIGAVVTFIDISNRKIAEKEQQENEARLKELNATKDKFFSLIAHDLKNPVGSIVGFLDLLKKEFDSYNRQQIEKYVGIIHQGATHAYNLLENLLVWGQTQTGRMEFNPEAAGVRKLVLDSINFVEPQSVRKDIEIIEKIEKDEIIVVDRNMILTVIRNLLANAIKYSPPGGKVEVMTASRDDQVVFMVKDYGVGMDAKTMNEIFRLEKTDSIPGTENEKGTGLGLIICKEFIDKHGGSIWAESTKGKGSTFTFTLPAGA